MSFKAAFEPPCNYCGGNHSVENCTNKVTNMKWSKETPVEEGWYWMKYKNKHGRYVKCPAHVFHAKDTATVVKSAYNDTFVEGPNHGGPGLKCNGKPDLSILFGPKIEEPE